MKAVEIMARAGWMDGGGGDPDTDIRSGYTSDLLSDVVAHAPPDSALVTLQAHLTTVAVASLAGIRLVVICHSRPIPEDAREAAIRERIALARTPQNQYDATLTLAAVLGSQP